MLLCYVGIVSRYIFETEKMRCWQCTGRHDRCRAQFLSYEERTGNSVDVNNGMKSLLLQRTSHCEDKATLVLSSKDFVGELRVS